MPYKFIGRTTDFKGKTLWEILGNLKNFGIGRIIGRNMFQRYSEPCYIKVLKVEALPNPVVPIYAYDNPRKVIVLCEKVFRGVKSPNLIQLESSTYKADYFLVPKHEEENFCRISEQKDMKILPSHMKLPPYVAEQLRRQMEAEGTPMTEEPKMKIVYNLSGSVKKYRVAEEGETPTVPEPTLGFGKPVSPKLLENIQEC